MERPPIYIPPDPPGLAVPSGETHPDALVFFRLYGGLMVLMHFLLLCVGAFLLAVPGGLGGSIAATRSIDGLLAGLFYLAWGLVLGVPWTIALFGPRRPWVHTLGTILVAFSMMSICCLPAAIPLLIHWNKPETRRYFTEPA